MQNRTFATYVGATAERTWQSLTDPDLVPLFFFGLRIRSEGKPGSPLVLHGPGPDTAIGYVVDVLHERRLVYAFHSGAPDAGPTSWLTWEIEEGEPGVCRVTLSHDDLEKAGDPDQDADVLRLLSNFKTLLETGRTLSAEPRLDESREV
jgi:uncharacterized protein YndB with AHSA1/START domain